MAKVSIIIPIYNVEGYVRRTIESARCQTEPDIEIILVDDGSTDGSGSICDETALLDERLTVIHKQNGGLSSARNAGTKAATSDYVMFLDGDDYLREDAVECCLKAMQAYPCDFVQYLYQEVVEGQEPERRESTGEIYQATTSKELFENLYRLGGVAASGATKFMRRSLALEIPFENIRHEDEMWCTRAFQRNLTGTYLPEELYFYVMRSGSIIHSEFNRKKLDRLRVSECRIDALTACGYVELLDKELVSVFLSILTFYKEAMEACDTAAVKEIKDFYKRYRKQFGECKLFPAKFAILNMLMSMDFRFLKLYTFYWKYMK